MVWERIRAWLDNPIFVKHVRSRLRLQPLLTAIVVVQALCLCIAWAGFQLGSFANGRRVRTAFSFSRSSSWSAIGVAQVGDGRGGSAGVGHP